MKSCHSLETSNGAFTTHDLIVHFDDAEYLEKNFSEESCFMDILEICKRFIDIYLAGFKITDEDGRPLKDDRDVLFMMEENKMFKDIHIYLDKDKTSQPLSFRMPLDNSNLDSHTPVIPKVINAKISGVLKDKKKVVVKGDVIDGSEMASTAQLFILVSKEFDNEDDLKPISQPQIDLKVFQLSEEAADYYLVAKYTPIAADGKIGVPVYVISDKCVEWKNKNKVVVSLKSGEKYQIEF